MTDPRLLDLQQRFKRVLFETTIDEGFDRDASHAEGRYVAYQVGLTTNAHLLDSIPEIAHAYAERAAERLIQQLGPSDLAYLLDLAERRGTPLLRDDEQLNGDTCPVMSEVVEADPAEAIDVTPDDGELDAAALDLARQEAGRQGLPLPERPEQIKLSHWRRAALRATWHARLSA